MYPPLVVMLVATFTSLGMTIYSKAQALMTMSTADMFGDVLQLVFAILIIIIGISVVFEGARKLLLDNKENNGKTDMEPEVQ